MVLQVRLELLQRLDRIIALQGTRHELRHDQPAVKVDRGITGRRCQGDPRRPIRCLTDVRRDRAIRLADDGRHAVADFVAGADAVVRPVVALEGPDRGGLGFPWGHRFALEPQPIGQHEPLDAVGPLALAPDGEAEAISDLWRLPDDQAVIAVGIRTQFDGHGRSCSPAMQA